MAVEISRLRDKDYQALATAADRATGRPDGRTSVEEIDAYLEANAVLLRGERPPFDLRWLRRSITLLETDDSLTPERRAELIRIAAACGAAGRSTPELIANQGVTDPGEREWVDELAGYYRELAYRLPQALDRAIDEVATDGEISDDDRKLLMEAGRNAANNAPNAVQVAGIFAQNEAERRARVFRGIYSDAVRAGLVTGVPAGGPLEPPSAAAVNAVRDGSLAKQLTTAPRERVAHVVARFERSWPRTGQYDIEGLATELTQNWDKAPPSPTSPARVLSALFTSSERSLEKPDHRAALAAAVVRRLTDAQLAQLDAPLVAELAAALSGGGLARYSKTSIEQSAHYVLPSAVNGPRIFGIQRGRGTTLDAPLTRLREATSARFTWRTPGERYGTALELLEPAS